MVQQNSSSVLMQNAMHTSSSMLCFRLWSGNVTVAGLVSGIVFNSIQFKFICIALFMIQIVAKQLYKNLSFYNIFSSSLSEVTISRLCTYGTNVW